MDAEIISEAANYFGTKKLIDAESNIFSLDILKQKVSKILEQSNSESSENDTKSTSLKTIRRKKLLKQRKTKDDRQSNERTKPKIKRKKSKQLNKIVTSEQGNELKTRENDRKMQQDSDQLMDVITMVSEVTISDVEKEMKNRNLQNEDNMPSPQLNRASLIVQKTFKKKQITYKAGQKTFREEYTNCEQINKTAEVHNQILKSINPILIMKKHTKYRERKKASRKDERKQHPITDSLPNHVTCTSQSDNSNTNIRCTDRDVSILNNSTGENQETVQTPIELNIIPPSDEIQPLKDLYAENESAPNCFCKLLEKYSSEIPNSAKESWEVYQKLHGQGYIIALRTLQRGLMTPTDQRLLKEIFGQFQKENENLIS